jgi:hypothetical protein
MKAGPRPEAHMVVPVSVTIERLRLVVLYLGVVPRDLVISHPALEAVSLSVKGALCDGWKRRCQTSSHRSLWFDLANLWLSDTPTEDFSFRQLVLKTRRYF